jgi:hypothetical protein
MAKLKYYIGRRDNPQLKQPYYRRYGQLSKTDAKKKENPAYGSMSLTGYDTEEEYEKEIARLVLEGFTVN